MAEPTALFLRACRRLPVERPPIWFMRQAGRYLPEYREVRRQVDFLTLCRTPELACEVTLQPIRRFGFDASILFADILTPVIGLGVDIDFAPGPVVREPIRERSAAEALRALEPEADVPYVLETVRLLRGALGEVPLIGFAGAPFTVAAYLVEGQGKTQFPKFRALLHSDPDTVAVLLERLTDMTIRYLSAQIAAGVQAVQLFDSWAGLLSPAQYRSFCLPYVRRIVEAIRPLGVPFISFAGSCAAILEPMAEAGADVLAIDWRVPLDTARRRLAGREVALQGNLDPCALFAPPEVVRRSVSEVLEAAGSSPGHVFNLGHGILPETPVDSVAAAVETVRGAAARG